MRSGHQAKGNTDAVSQEQAYVSMLYDLLDDARKRTEEALAGTLSQGSLGGTFQARVEREFTAVEQSRRLSQLEGVEHGLCFGRTDAEDSTYYIGRIGLRDENHDPKLIDWRAPAARPFYAATPRDPAGLIRRRHIYTRSRRVTAVDDEVFDLDKLSDDDRSTLSGEAMLIAGINKARTGRMQDVVATIQAEQDKVIRSPLQGVLVVQGGPGTGKTVAALHRAAYLLYTHRRTLERRGILIIGPNPTFLRYISQVLPSLGETDAVLTSIAEMIPGITARPDDNHQAAVLKGDVKIAEVLRQAIRNHQRIPSGDLVIDIDGVVIKVARDQAIRARDRARNLRKQHNVARKLFATDMLTALARAEARTLDRPLDPEDIPHARARLWDEPAARAAIDELWPFLTPQRLVAGLLAEEAALRRAAPDLSAAERSVLLRPAAPDSWTVADVPLLDEAAQLLGADDSADKARQRALERERREEEKYAREVLISTGLAGMAGLDAKTLAEWNRDQGITLTTAERAWADPDWAYGHVIVDEAQELSAMAWRMVMRRIPTRSMTIVGDIAQRGSAAGATSWSQMLGRTRFRVEQLTVNYRTPEEIMAVAARVLKSVAPQEQPPESVRSEGVPPRAVPAKTPAEVSVLVADELTDMGSNGRLAIIAPAAHTDALSVAIPEAVLGDRPESLDAQVALLTVIQAKGLEFDRVVLVDPAAILAQSPVGGHDLYVAITRATRRLTITYPGDLPAELRIG
jgi:DNA helicase IV